VGLEEFSLAVEQRGAEIVKEERDGWAQILATIMGEGASAAAMPGATQPDEGGQTNPVTPMDRLEQVFQAVDGDANLGLAELMSLLGAMGVHMSEVQAAVLRDSMDANGDGTVSLCEFQGIYEKQKGLATDRTWLTFLHFLKANPSAAEDVEDLCHSSGVDGNASLDEAQLSAIMVSDLGVSFEPLQLKLLYCDLDANEDGALSMQEFSQAIEERSIALGLVAEPLAAAELTEAVAGLLTAAVSVEEQKLVVWEGVAQQFVDENGDGSAVTFTVQRPQFLEATMRIYVAHDRNAHMQAAVLNIMALKKNSGKQITSLPKKKRNEPQEIASQRVERLLERAVRNTAQSYLSRVLVHIKRIVNDNRMANMTPEEHENEAKIQAACKTVADVHRVIRGVPQPTAIHWSETERRRLKTLEESDLCGISGYLSASPLVRLLFKLNIFNELTHFLVRKSGFAAVHVDSLLLFPPPRL
jgi:Ca2+-binding EF-hand superfamily protein